MQRRPAHLVEECCKLGARAWHIALLWLPKTTKERAIHCLDLCIGLGAESSDRVEEVLACGPPEPPPERCILVIGIGQAWCLREESAKAVIPDTMIRKLFGIRVAAPPLGYSVNWWQVGTVWSTANCITLRAHGCQCKTPGIQARPTLLQTKAITDGAIMRLPGVASMRHSCRCCCPAAEQQLDARRSHGCNLGLPSPCAGGWEAHCPRCRSRSCLGPGWGGQPDRPNVAAK
mmetsp:Transcript_94163/g.275424  ORF Transcript_94163/g.275424 Transcript_94163/m.275424 type:complete len:232 (+) Transcript_94163:553-1248(+)